MSTSLALQLFSLANELRQDLEGTLAAVAAIGFRHVELAGLLGRDAASLAGALRAAGLECHSAHVPLKPYRPSGDPSLQDLAGLVEAAGRLGLRDIIVPMFPLPERAGGPAAGESVEGYFTRAAAMIGADDWKALAALLNQNARTLALHGLGFGYHNHNVEFARCGETTGYEILIEHTDPALVHFELDVGWARAAGLDPAALLRRHPGRFRWLHLKDLAATTPCNTRFQLHPADLGTGLIDWTALLHAAADLGIHQLVVEREPPFSEPPLLTIEQHWRFLSDRLPA
ncbi:MAG: sugar phosphate isomerase/epimerase [Pseudomonadota bacterium]